MFCKLDCRKHTGYVPSNSCLFKMATVPITTTTTNTNSSSGGSSSVLLMVVGHAGSAAAATAAAATTSCYWGLWVGSAVQLLLLSSGCVCGVEDENERLKCP
jgi:hypothetical protein